LPEANLYRRQIFAQSKSLPKANLCPKQIFAWIIVTKRPRHPREAGMMRAEPAGHGFAMMVTSRPRHPGFAMMVASRPRHPGFDSGFARSKALGFAQVFAWMIRFFLIPHSFHDYQNKKS
jgi:hypothetical protein